MPALARLAPLLLAAAGAVAHAQTAAPAAAEDLPKNLHGRWTSVAVDGKATAQPFDLENIERQEGGAFKARLSWTTADPRCTIRYQPITGRLTDSSLSFDAATACKDALTAKLSRGAGAWVGEATIKATPPVVVQLTAK
jgi:hypothetical protein